MKENHQQNDTDILNITSALVEAKSISPMDAGCQKILAEKLKLLGFRVEHLPFEDVENIWATHGSGAPYFVFAGHTDVVPSGPLEQWHTDPFTPTLIDGELFGRGTADMKGSLAAMYVACKKFLSSTSQHQGTLAFLITSDEEADAINGTQKVLKELHRREINIDWCLIGEPSSDKQLGDVVKTGRRGSLHASIKVQGQQGHVAYPDDANNPIHSAMPALAALCNESWDSGNEFFPPTSMQISNIKAGTGVTNVIPGELELLLNFRFSTESSQESLSRRTESILNSFPIEYEIQWTLSGNPFLTVDGKLIPAVQRAIKSVLGLEATLSTSGGTSDGRFIAPTGAEVVEVGPCNATIHKVNEKVSINDLSKLSDVYEHVLHELLL